MSALNHVSSSGAADIVGFPGTTSVHRHTANVPEPQGEHPSDEPRPMVMIGRGRPAAPTGIWAKLVWMLNGMLGANAYQSYLEHHRQTHPGEAPLDERTFWRRKAEDEDRNPGARCC